MAIIVQLGDVDTGRSLAAQYAPTELKETHGAEYASLVVPGLSHKILQFTNTDNSTLELEFEFNALTNPKISVSEQRRWLLHFLYPSRKASSVATGAPPRCLFFWQKLFSFTCRITKVEITHTFFSPDGSEAMFKAKPTFAEARDTRLTSEDVLAGGTVRNA